MKRFLCLLLILPVLAIPGRAETIKWVDFDVPYESLKYAMEQDIATLENNMGFFARTKNADSMIADVKKKISIAKEELARIEEKIRIIDNQFE